MCRKENCHENPQGCASGNKSGSMSLTSPASGTAMSLFSPTDFLCPNKTELPNFEKWIKDT